MKRMRRLTARVQTILAVGVLAAASVGAATTNVYVWTGAAAGDSSNWFNPTNWNGPSGYGVPGDTHNPAGLVLDAAFILPASNVSGTINYTYTPGEGPHTNVFSWINLNKTDLSVPLVFNVNGNMTVQHNNVADPDWDQKVSYFGGNTAFTLNVNSGTCGVERGAAWAYNANVASGAALVIAANSSVGSGSPRPLTLLGDTSVAGWCGSLGPERGDGIKAPAPVPITVSGTLQVKEGGILYPCHISQGGSFQYSTITITNGATVQTRHGGSGYIIGSGFYGQGYVYATRMYGGAVTNRGVLALGTPNGNGAAAKGSGTLLIYGGTWFQGGAVYAGDGRVGEVVINNATFDAASDVYVGSGLTDSTPSPTAPFSGTLTISNGTVAVSNPDAGTLRTTTRAGRDNPSAITHYFGVTLNTWDYTYMGQRLVVDSLAGSGNGLLTNVVYYPVNINTAGNRDQKSEFAMALTPYGLGLTGSVSYAAGCVYHTLPARLLVGNMRGFAGGATYLMNTGTLNLVSGSLTADELIATNGAASVLNFLGGSLTVKNATDISNGVETVFGNGVSSALLELVAGTHRFADGLVITNNATLAAGGTNAVGSVSVTGDLAFAPGAALDVDFDAATNDWLEVSGAVALADEMTLVLRMSGDTARSPVTVLKASEGITGSVVAWPAVTVNSVKYRAVVAGDQLRLEKVARGTLVGIL